MINEYGIIRAVKMKYYYIAIMNFDMSKMRREIMKKLSGLLILIGLTACTSVKSGTGSENTKVGMPRLLNIVWNKAGNLRLEKQKMEEATAYAYLKTEVKRMNGNISEKIMQNSM